MKTNREKWLGDALAEIYIKLVRPHAQLPEGRKVEVSCGWPSIRATANKHRRIGECWAPEACEDKKTVHIFISPALNKPMEVLECLAHELIHAVLPSDVKHGPPFKRVARGIGLEGKLTATHAGDELKEVLGKIAYKLGIYPHLTLSASNRPKQSTRLIRLEAVNCCKYVVRTTRKWIVAEGFPRCPHGKVLASRNLAGGMRQRGITTV